MEATWALNHDDLYIYKIFEWVQIRVLQTPEIQKSLRMKRKLV
jgi:hypothetical protein